MAVGKYTPLTETLTAATARGEVTLRLTFRELAALVGGLPTSAYRRREWWANGYLVQAKSWRVVGWRVRRVDLAGEWVSFVREEGPPTGADTPGASTSMTSNR